MSEDFRVRWGNNVELGRNALQLTQVQLADLCGVTQQTISGIERGEQTPRDGLKLRLAEVLHQETHVLFPLTRSVA